MCYNFEIDFLLPERETFYTLSTVFVFISFVGSKWCYRHKIMASYLRYGWYAKKEAHIALPCTNGRNARLSWLQVMAKVESFSGFVADDDISYINLSFFIYFLCINCSVSTTGMLAGIKMSHAALTSLCRSMKLACELYPSRHIALCLDPYCGLGFALWCLSRYKYVHILENFSVKRRNGQLLVEFFI